MDEKSLFSPHVAKESIAAVIRTPDQLIVAQLHARPQKRLKDEMNHVSDRFIALTDARVYDSGGARLLCEAAFMLLSNAHIVSITPVSAIERCGDGEWSRVIADAAGETAPSAAGDELSA